MKLYYSPLACSLADHIALREAGAVFDLEQVDLQTKRTLAGRDFAQITPKAYVPVLILDNGETLTENIAILDWLAAQYPKLGGAGAFARTRLLEALAFISTELHRSFKPMWHAASEADRNDARPGIAAHFRLIENGATSVYLFGNDPTVADFYLFVMLLWAERFGVEVPPRLAALRDAMRDRPAVRTALRAEGLA